MDEQLRPDTDDRPIDPIGPPVLPKVPRHSARALALAGFAIGSPLAAAAIGMVCPTPTWPPSPF